jgi:hypothetical protein
MSQPAHTHKYINRIPEREHNLFLEEYYSGTDTKVYIDNNPQTEIAYISYSVNEQLKPLYGYASRTWDDVAIGNRIVTGVLKISVKNPEEQSSYEEVVLHQVIDKEQSTLEEIAEMNKAEEEAKQEIEWPDDTSNKTSGDEEERKSQQKVDYTKEYNSNDSLKPKETFSQEVQSYQIKLQTLGYNIPIADGLIDQDGEVMGLTVAAILEFCSDHGIIPDRKFTTTIKKEIDKALKTETLQKHEIISTAFLLKGPGDEYGAIMVASKGCPVYIIDKQDIWFKVKILSEVEGWVTGYVRSIFVD